MSEYNYSATDGWVGNLYKAWVPQPFVYKKTVKPLQEKICPSPYERMILTSPIPSILPVFKIPIKSPEFISIDNGYILVVPLLGYDRSSLTVKLMTASNSELVITATNGGLDGTENYNKKFTIPKNANFEFDTTLLNGVLRIKTGVLMLAEIKLVVK